MSAQCLGEVWVASACCPRPRPRPRPHPLPPPAAPGEAPSPITALLPPPCNPPVNTAPPAPLLLQHLEKTGELPEALKHYELSGCAHIEVPRMYFETHQIGELEKYVNSKV